MKLRDYQQKAADGVESEWDAGAKNVMLVMPCRSGKTPTFCDIIMREKTPSIAIAHRSELVGQMSRTLGKYGVKHNIIASKSTIRQIIKTHLSELGKSWYDPNATACVASVNTLVARKDTLVEWGKQVRLWVTDEGHHLLRENMWGRAIDLFPNARGLSVTATPFRADGKGLGRETHGLIDSIVMGPSMRGLINRGLIAEYRIFAPDSDVDIEKVKISKSSGEFNTKQLTYEMSNSHIIGDVVDHYLRLGEMKPGITFCVNIEMANDVAAEYREKGVPAEVLTGKTSDSDRVRIVTELKNKKLLQIVAVDIISEGFDLDGIYVVSMARPTASLGLFIQQICRGLNPADDKPKALIIDHVGNVRRHGLPDRHRVWSLEPRTRRKKIDNNDEEKINFCPKCSGVYEGFNNKCPYCGFVREPVRRDGPEFVDGDLTEIDEETLAIMRGEIELLDAPVEELKSRMEYAGLSPIIVAGGAKRHLEKQEQQLELRHEISCWASRYRIAGLSDVEIYKKFYYTFSIDVLSAMALKRADAEILEDRIANAK